MPTQSSPQVISSPERPGQVKRLEPTLASCRGQSPRSAVALFLKNRLSCNYRIPFLPSLLGNTCVLAHTWAWGLPKAGGAGLPVSGAGGRAGNWHGLESALTLQLSGTALRDAERPSPRPGEGGCRGAAQTPGKA